MKPNIYHFILAVVIFSSCNTSKYYFKVRNAGEHNRTEEVAEISPIEKLYPRHSEKDSSVKVLEKNQTGNKSETDIGEVDWKKEGDNMQMKSSNPILPEKPEVKKASVKILKTRIRLHGMGKFERSKNGMKSSDFNWKEFFEITMEILVIIILLAAGLAMEGNLTWMAFLGLLGEALILGVIICFLLWLIFHNFFEGLRSRRSK